MLVSVLLIVAWSAYSSVLVFDIHVCLALVAKELGTQEGNRKEQGGTHTQTTGSETQGKEIDDTNGAGWGTA